MSERTGATDNDPIVTGMNEEQCRIAWEHGMTLNGVKALVPPGMVIARTADVLTTEQRMAWGELLDAANRIAYNQYHGKDGWNRVPVDQIEELVEATDAVARLGGLTADELRAIAEGGTE